MPRARDPARDKAREMWEASGRSMMLREIAKKLKVPEKTVSGWKSKDGWAKKNDWSTPIDDSSTPKDAYSTPKRKRGAQPGHPPQGGGKPGNLNAATHGAHMRIYGDLLTDEEKSLLDALTRQTERDRLLNLYAQHQITERRLMRHINDIMDGAEMIVHRTMSQIEPTGQRSADGREITKVVKISQEQESRKDQLRNFTDALTRVRAEMRRTAEALAKLRDETANDDVGSLVDAINAAWKGAADE